MNAITKYGILYLCPTPIGNLEDMTFRAVRILKEVSLIAAEDTRHTKKLLNHFEITTPLISYYEHNKHWRSKELIARLLQGADIALVSDAGMPGICDPGSDLVKQAIGKNIQVTPLPGANAALTALVASGLPADKFTFIGFLPKTTKKRGKLLTSLKEHEYCLIFYESPHKLVSTLDEMLSILGDRQVVAARELSKKFEEFVRGPLSTVSQHFKNTPPKGEFTLIVDTLCASEILGGGDCMKNKEIVDEQVLAKAVEEKMLAGENKKDAISKVASQFNISKRTVYQAVISNYSP